MQERFDAVIVAGYDRNKTDALTEQSGEPHKVLIKIAGKPMIWYVVNALAQSQAIERIVVVGLGPEAGVEFGHPVYYLADQGAMFDNIVFGFTWLAQSQNQDRCAMLLTGDIPLLTSAMVDQFVAACQPLDQDVYWGIVEKTLMEATFPNSQRSYLRAVEGNFCNGNLFLGKIYIPLKRQQLIQQMLEQRKSVVRQLRLLGFGVILRFLLHQLRLRDLLNVVQRALDIRGAPIILPFAESGMDVDKPHQLAQVLAYVEKQKQGRKQPMRSKFRSLVGHLHVWDVSLSARIVRKLDEDQPRPLGYWPALLIAHLGDSWLWLLIAGLLFKSAYRLGAEGRKPRITLVWMWLLSVIAATLATLLVKRQVQRPRPGKRPLLYGRGADVHSFPSGHAARLGAIAVWGNVLWPQRGSLTWVLALLVGWSRVALGIHYGGDVVAGWVLGGMIALLFRKIGRPLSTDDGSGLRE